MTKIKVFQDNFAFVIGIDEYEDSKLNTLRTPISDAMAIGEVLAQKQHGFEVMAFYNSTALGLRYILEQMLDVGKNEDARIVFYYAGHGVNLDLGEGPQGYFVPSDAKRGDESTFVPMQELIDVVEKIKSRHVLLILDCCFAGSIKWAGAFHRDTGSFEQKISRQYYHIFTQNKARQVLTSTSHRQKALDRYEEADKNSPFAQTLLDVLSGNHSNISEDGLITLHEIQNYIQEHLRIGEGTTSDNIQKSELIALHSHEEGEFCFFLDFFDPNTLTEAQFKNPYKGLDSFEQGDKNIFFGRNEAISDLYTHSLQHALTIVVGASGTGKSSLVKAGLIPRLLNEEHTTKNIPIIRPGRQPMKALDNPSIQSFDYLVIDQWEEVITQAESDVEVRAFNAQLLCWLEEGKKIIGTVRADFEAQIQRDGLEALWMSGRWVVPSFTAEEYRQVIYLPAKRVGCLFKPADLVNDIVEEVKQQPGPLPLLSFMMSELFAMAKAENAMYPLIRKEHHDKIKGVSGALSNKANEVYDQLPDETYRSIMRKICLRMVSLSAGELAGRRVFREELDFGGDKKTIVQTVIHHLTEARLIRGGMSNFERGTHQTIETEQRAFIEPAHDALVRAWGRLWEWVKELGASNLLLSDKVVTATNDYLRNGQEKSYLWKSDARLDQSRELQHLENNPLNVHEGKFISRSFKVRRENARVLWGTVIGVICILGSMTLWAINQRDIAIKKQKEAQAQGLNLAASSLVGKDIRLSLLLAKASYQINPSAEAMQTISASMYGIFDTKEVPYVNFESSRNAIFSPDNKIIIIRTDKDTVKLWSMEGGIFAVLGLHRDPSNDFIFSPDSTSIITYSEDNIVKLWNLKGQLLSTLKGHKDYIINAEFLPNGNRIITYSGDNTVKLWNLKGKLLASFDKHKDYISDVNFSPDEKLMLSYSDDGTAKLWNQKGEIVANLDGHKAAVKSANFSPNGRHILTYSNDSTAKLWNFKGDLLANLNGHRTGIKSAHFSPDGRRILIAYEDASFKLWNLNGELIHELGKNLGIGRSINFSHDGRLFAICLDDGTVNVWNFEGELVIVLVNHNNKVYNVSFSPNGQYIVTSSIDKTVNLWDLKGNLLINWKGYGSNAHFSPNGKFIIIFSNNLYSIKIWTLKGELFADLNKHNHHIIGTNFSPDGDYLITYSRDKSTKVWNLKKRLVLDLDAQGTNNDASFSPNGQYILTYSNDKNTTKLWNLKGVLITDFKTIGNANFSPNGKLIVTCTNTETAKVSNLKGEFLADLSNHNSRINNAIFSPNGKLILTHSDNNIVKLWSLKGELLANLDKHTSRINNFIFSPSGKFILTSSDDKTAKLWNFRGELLLNLAMHTDKVFNAKFSPEEKFIITSSRDHTAKLWNLEGDLLANLKKHQGHVINSIFSPDGKFILTYSKDNTAKLWNLDGKLLANLNKHTENVVNACFSPNGRYILTCSDDNTAKLWSPSGELLANLDRHTDDVKNALFSQNCKYILTCSNDKTAKIWNIKGILLADLTKHKGWVWDAIFSPDGKWILTHADDETVKLWPTPNTILRWLNTNPFPPLSKEEKALYHIED